jgi:hypothetical protein
MLHVTDPARADVRGGAFLFRSGATKRGHPPLASVDPSDGASPPGSGWLRSPGARESLWTNLEGKAIGQRYIVGRSKPGVPRPPLDVSARAGSQTVGP